jgi:hypothetical protein
MTPRPEPLPDGAIMFHAGFHKTGTTALQSAFATSRPELLEAGVLYPGNRRSHHRAAMVVTRRTWGWEERGGRRTEPKYWGRVARAAAAYEGRVVISSEGFALADDEALDRIVDRLGAERLHAVFTLRPMSRLLASSWQQYLKYGLAMRYENWLKNVFAAPPECPPTPNFWRRNDHAGIMARWAQRLGPDRVTLVVLDERDREYLFRTFEHLLDLPSGLLVPDPELSASNRSMTAAEAEMLRQVNAGGAKRWDWPQYEKLVRRGAILRMVESRTPEPDEESLGTPQWAIQAAQDVGRATAGQVADLGIRVHGDLASLADPIPAGDPPTDALRLPVHAAAEAVLGAISGAMAGKPVAPESDQAINKLDLPAVQRLTTREAADLLKLRLGEAREWRMAKLRRSTRALLRRS